MKTPSIFTEDVAAAPRPSLTTTLTVFPWKFSLSPSGGCGYVFQQAPTLPRKPRRERYETSNMIFLPLCLEWRSRLERLHVTYLKMNIVTPDLLSGVLIDRDSST